MYRYKILQCGWKDAEPIQYRAVILNTYNNENSMGSTTSLVHLCFSSTSVFISLQIKRKKVNNCTITYINYLHQNMIYFEKNLCMLFTLFMTSNTWVDLLVTSSWHFTVTCPVWSSWIFKSVLVTSSKSLIFSL